MHHLCIRGSRRRGQRVQFEEEFDTVPQVAAGEFAADKRVHQNGRSRLKCLRRPSGGASPRDVAESWLRAAKGAEAFACFPRNESLKSCADKRGRFLNTRSFSCSIQQGIVDEDANPHMNYRLAERFFARRYVFHELEIDFVAKAGLIAQRYRSGRRDFDGRRNDVALPVALAR